VSNRAIRRALAAAVLLSLAGSSYRRAPQTRLVVVYPIGLRSLDAHGINEETALSILGNVYDTLVETAADFGLRPGLAESWHNPDDLTWVFRLRPRVIAHDGREVRAADVVEALQRARQDRLSQVREHLAEVESIAAPDARTVVVRTRRPFGALTRHLANVFVGLPADASGRPVGTGPYRVQAWTPGGHVVLEAFPAHWRGRPALDSVEFLAVPDGARRLGLVRRGDADIAADVPGSEIPALAADPAVAPRVAPGLRVLYLGMDCRPPRPGRAASPFHDVRVRRAVGLAVDRAALVAGPLDGFGQVTGQLVASPVFGHAADVEAPARDPAAARAMLARGGWPEGFAVDLDYAPAKYRGAEAVADAVARDLAEVGIRARPRPRAFPDLLDRVRAGLVTFYLSGALPSSGDAGLVYDYLLRTREGSHGSLNGGRCSDSAVDALLEAGASRLDAGDRADLLHRVAHVVEESAPVVPLVIPSDLYAVRRGLAFAPRPDRRIRVSELRPPGRTAVAAGLPLRQRR
jgi:peptide/nickel transport system substrate-binding protein